MFDLSDHIYQRNNLWFNQIADEPRNQFVIKSPWGNIPSISFNTQVIPLPNYDDTLLSKAQDFQSMLSITADMIEGAFTQEKITMPLYLLAHVEAIRTLLAVTDLSDNFPDDAA